MREVLITAAVCGLVFAGGAAASGYATGPYEGKSVFEGRWLLPGEAVYEDFISEHGRSVPDKRSDGRALSGSQAAFAYCR
jgi:hypothetical protein